MTISETKLSALCNSSEIQVVRASRRPELNQLTHAELKRLAARARKLADKWHGQSRSQARKISRQVGSGLSSRNTSLKSQVFSEALHAIGARLAELETPAQGRAKSRPKTRKIRNAGHRATRAKVRKGLARSSDNL
jgi:hypothetical protein